jgi:hypothetical protein
MGRGIDPGIGMAQMVKGLSNAAVVQVLEARIREAGLGGVRDEIIDVVVYAADDLARDHINAYILKLDAEDAERRRVYRSFVNILSPLVRDLGLLPGERVISVAVRSSDGEVRIVSIGE